MEKPDCWLTERLAWHEESANCNDLGPKCMQPDMFIGFGCQEGILPLTSVLDKRNLRRGRSMKGLCVGARIPRCDETDYPSRRIRGASKVVDHSLGTKHGP